MFTGCWKHELRFTSHNIITRYSWRSKSGKIVDSLLNVSVKEKQELKMGDGQGLEYWPELNCMDQDDPRLIEHIRTHQLRPPSMEATTMNQTYYGSEVEVCFADPQVSPQLFRESLELWTNVTSLREGRVAFILKLELPMEGR